MIALVLSATLAAPPGGADLSNRCAEALAALALAGTVEAAASGNTVALAGKPLRLSARVEEERQADSQWMVGIAVQVAPPGNASALAFGVVCTGSVRCPV